MSSRRPSPTNLAEVVKAIAVVDRAYTKARSKVDNRDSDSGFGTRDSGFGIRDSGFRVRDLGFEMRPCKLRYTHAATERRKGGVDNGKARSGNNTNER